MTWTLLLSGSAASVTNLLNSRVWKRVFGRFLHNKLRPLPTYDGQVKFWEWLKTRLYPDHQLSLDPSHHHWLVLRLESLKQVDRVCSWRTETETLMLLAADAQIRRLMGRRLARQCPVCVDGETEGGAAHRSSRIDSIYWQMHLGAKSFCELLI